MRKPFHFFQPRPPTRPQLTTVFVFGGTLLCLAVIFGIATLLNTIFAQATLLLVGIGCLVIALVQAVISGVFISQWTSPPKQTVSFYLSFTFVFLLLFWVGLAAPLLMFNPGVPPFLVVNMWIPLGAMLGLVLILPWAVVQFRQRRRDARRRPGGSTNEG